MTGCYTTLPTILANLCCFELRKMDTHGIFYELFTLETTFVTSSFLSCTTIHFIEGVFLKKKELCSIGKEILFPLEQTHTDQIIYFYHRMHFTQEAQKSSMAASLTSTPIPLG